MTDIQAMRNYAKEKLGATDLQKSTRKNKRFMVEYQGRLIHFGSATGSTFGDHGDEKKRKAWRARHSKIKRKDGSLAYKDKNSPSYWSWNLLW